MTKKIKVKKAATRINVTSNTAPKISAAAVAQALGAELSGPPKRTRKRVKHWQDGGLDDETYTTDPVEYAKLPVLEDPNGLIWKNYLEACEQVRRMKTLIIGMLEYDVPLDESERAFVEKERAAVEALVHQSLWGVEGGNE